MSLSRRVLTALVAGLAVGVAVAASNNASLLRIAPIAETIGTLWVNAIRMTVIPLVVSLLILSVGSVNDVKEVGRTGARALMLFVAFLIASASIAGLMAPFLLSLFHVDAATTAAIRGSAGTATAITEGIRKLPTFSQWLLELIPVNPVRSAADGAMLPLVIFSLLFALASTRATPGSRKAIVDFFRAVSEAMLVLVRWVIALAPIGVFALMLGLAARVGASAVGALGYFVLVVSVITGVLLIALYPVVAIAGRMSVKRFAQAVFPAQAVAFGSRSSLASLPALIASAETRLAMPPAISGFVLPLSVSTFKLGAPVSGVVGALFLAQLYGVTFTALDIVLVGAVSIILSFSTPGIPSGSLIVVAPLYASLGLPIEGIGILIAVDVIPDTFKTVLNVTADMAVAAIVARGAEREPGTAG